MRPWLTAIIFTTLIALNGHILLSVEGYNYDLPTSAAMSVALITLFIIFISHRSMPLSIAFPLWCVFTEGIPAAWANGHLVAFPLYTLIFLLAIPGLFKIETASSKKG